MWVCFPFAQWDREVSRPRIHWRAPETCRLSPGRTKAGPGSAHSPPISGAQEAASGTCQGLGGPHPPSPESHSRGHQQSKEEAGLGTRWCNRVLRADDLRSLCNEAGVRKAGRLRSHAMGRPRGTQEAARSSWWPRASHDDGSPPPEPANGTPASVPAAEAHACHPPAPGPPPWGLPGYRPSSPHA